MGVRSVMPSESLVLYVFGLFVPTHLIRAIPGKGKRGVG
jgi:hypothetical protein